MASVNEAYAALRHVARPLPPTPPPRPTPPPAPTRPLPRPPTSQPPPADRRRGGCLVVAAVLAVLLIVGVAVAAVTAGGDEKGVPATWAVGSCVEGTDELTAVRCDGPHDGRIVDVGDAPDDCPDPTDGFVARRGYIWCVDTDR